MAHEKVLRAIILVRGQKVILDRDLAELYGVLTKVLIQAVKRNVSRFPADFMFRLSGREFKSLRSQIVTSNARGGRRSAPYAFTEQGVAMLSSILRSRRAIAVNIQIMRAFVRLHGILAEHSELARRLGELEERYDEKFEVVFDAIRSLMNPATQPRKRIGYLSAASFTPAPS